MKIIQNVEKTKKITNKPGFKTLIPEYSDAELIKILKVRDHYQSEAIAIAVEEAIKRGIINSEQDLLAKEFREAPLLLKNSFSRLLKMISSGKKLAKALFAA